MELTVWKVPRFHSFISFISFWWVSRQKKTKLSGLTLSIFCLSECAVSWELYNGSCYSLVSATFSISRSIEEASDVCQQSQPSSRLPSLHSLGEARWNYFDIMCSTTNSNWFFRSKYFFDRTSETNFFVASSGIWFWKTTLREEKETVHGKVCSPWMFVNSKLVTE